MKPSDPAAAARILPFTRPARRAKAELEFLPAALEIVETPASPLGRAIAGTIILFLCLALAWASLGTVDIIATTQGRVIPSGRTKVIQPFETGVVRAIHVTEGASVKAGDGLIELDPTADAADETRLAYALVQDRLDDARLQALLADDPARFEALITDGGPIEAPLVRMARRQGEAQAAEHRARLEALGRQIAGKQAEIRETEETIAKLNAALPLLREQRDIRKAALRSQFGSKIAYLQTEQQVVEAEHGLEEQRQHLAATHESLTSLEQQQAEIEAEYRKSLLADLAKADLQISEHSQELAKARQKRDLRRLVAPVDGTVQQLAVHTLGGIVTPAQPLMMIVPRDAGLEIETTLANKDVGFVHKGQEVEIKVEAFTFTRYGLLHGTVTSVSQDAVGQDFMQEARSPRRDEPEAANDEQLRQSRQPAYVAHVALKETGIETEQGYSPLDPGMAVTAEIKTGQRRIISYLLSPLLRYKHEGLRER